MHKLFVILKDVCFMQTIITILVEETKLIKIFTSDR